ncbi:sensor histidine kinase [Actinomyces faecalis]|uniref:sensor histidine kinase n=1 Tax=Actinomyces faecalis TaxID=2722820 RepID=UPI00155633E6|nr:histidine kinase [Actinomyces faecalis]
MPPSQDVPMTVSPAATRLMLWQEYHAALADALLALVILALGLPMGMLTAHRELTATHSTWLAVTYMVWAVCSLGLALRRRLPVLTWAVVTFAPPAHLAASTVVFHLQGTDVSLASQALTAVVVLGTPLSLATLAIRYRMGWAWAACVVSTLACAAVSSSLLPLALINVIGTLVGIILRIQHAQLIQVRKRSARLSLAREQTMMLAAANERSRIAREMHDIVAHSLAVMITMADGAAAAVDRNPEMAKQALTVLGDTGRSALADTRRLVGVLRDDPGASSAPQASACAEDHTDDATTRQPRGRHGRGEEPVSVQPPSTGSLPVVRELPVPEFAPPGTVAPSEPSEPIADLRRHATNATADRSTGEIPLAPAPETGDLETLVERFQAAGVPVSYTWTGAALPEDKGLQLTLFRIAQESMTNILRYAPTTKDVQVTVQRHTGTVVLTVTNEAAPGATPMHGSGKGLIGMRERASVYGGTVDAGPTPTGWQVRAVLRWDEDDEGTSPWQLPL